VEFTNPKIGKPSKNLEGYLTITLSKCDHCNSILERRYKIPTEEDMRKAKPWRYEDE
jgi:hypothetical protein